MTDEYSKTANKRSKWTTRDIMVTAILSIALGVIYIPMTYFTGWLMVSPITLALVMGIYFWPIILVSYLIRKPGVALFSSLIAFIVQVPFTPWGVTVLMHVITVGLPIEVLLLVRGYKNFKLWYLMLIGAISVLISAIIDFIMYGLGNLTPLLQIVFFAEAMVSGAILGGLVAKLIGDAVLKTGVISDIRHEDE